MYAHRTPVFGAWLLSLAFAPPSAGAVSPTALETAAYVEKQHVQEVINLLGELVAFETVHEPGQPNATLPAVVSMKSHLKEFAAGAGLEFQDHGAVVVVALGDSPERLGVLTHGDVQPANPALWKRSPFVMDRDSIPGKLIGRGTEDDKGSIAVTLYAMQAVKERKVPLKKRIELIISFTEESDWTPFTEFLTRNPPPPVNVSLDAEYPVTVAEKGFCAVEFQIPPAGGTLPADRPVLEALQGGSFISQVPEEAMAKIIHSTPELKQRLQARSEKSGQVAWRFQEEGSELTVFARGVSAHSSKPWEGKNALAHMAALLAGESWPRTAASDMVRILDDLVGTGYLGEKFGQIAYSHPFIGPLTLNLSTVRGTPEGQNASMNLRLPAGKTRAEVETTLRDTLNGWSQKHSVPVKVVNLYVGEPYFRPDAPQVPDLLKIFAHFTGKRDPQPVGVGGGTHARVVPNGVNFGPGMPGEVYTGHTEHEFLTVQQLTLNLKMVTAMLVELAGMPGPG